MGDSSEEEHPPLESEHGDIMIAQCSGCGSDLPQKHECLKFGLCRTCWRKRGSPFIQAGNTCGECEKPFWATRGIPSRLGVCKPCFDRLRNQTVSDYYGGLEPELGPTWQHNSVFLGNLEYQILPTEVQQYVHDLLFGGTDLCQRG